MTGGNEREKREEVLKEAKCGEFGEMNCWRFLT